MTTREALLARIDAYLASKGMTDRQFGEQVMRDPKFMLNLRRGSRGVTLATIERIEAFIDGRPVEPPRRRRQDLHDAPPAPPLDTAEPASFPKEAA